MKKNNTSTSNIVAEKISCDDSIKGKLLVIVPQKMQEIQTLCVYVYYLFESGHFLRDISC